MFNRWSTRSSAWKGLWEHLEDLEQRQHWTLNGIVLLTQRVKRHIHSGPNLDPSSIKFTIFWNRRGAFQSSLWPSYGTRKSLIQTKSQCSKGYVKIMVLIDLVYLYLRKLDRQCSAACKQSRTPKGGVGESAISKIQPEVISHPGGNIHLESQWWKCQQKGLSRPPWCRLEETGEGWPGRYEGVYYGEHWVPIL